MIVPLGGPVPKTEEDEGPPYTSTGCVFPIDVFMSQKAKPRRGGETRDEMDPTATVLSREKGFATVSEAWLHSMQSVSR